jgi:hypothetical protein
MTIKQMITCLALLAIYIVGSASITVAQEIGTTGAAPTLTARDIDSLEPQDEKADDDAGPCCHTKGAPECGGSCDICCKMNEQASCVAGGCDPNNAFACTCDVVTSCSCN